MAWVLRGVRDGIVTTRYPRRPDGYGSGFWGAIEVIREPGAATDGVHVSAQMTAADVVGLCPTGAIALGTGDDLHVDRGRCILCGRCVATRPDLFAFSPSIETSSLTRTALVVPNVPEDEAAVDRVREDLRRRVKALRRSIHIRHVDAGSDGSEEWEVAALTNPVYDVQRLGIYITATPRHADVLMVTGAGTIGMAGPLRTTFDAMPDPKIVIAAGADPSSGGLFRENYATFSGIGDVVPVDVWVPGSPPSPFSLLHGILLGVGLLSALEPVA
jgi:Ni,Fe-hydrogenase III small subunit/ferredoxin